VTAAPDVARCGRDGCQGGLDPDGYCEVCGFRPTAATRRRTSVAPATAPTAGTRPTTGTIATTGTATGTAWVRSGGSRGDLGAGLVAVERMPERPAPSRVQAEPHLPAARRFCSGCNAPVGLERDGVPALADGYCTACGQRYSFTPKLSPDDLVGGQYRVAGCLAHGGMGWLYLATDEALDGRWVVLKGLLDTGDEAAMAAAIVERRFLAQVAHQNVVEVHNFVEHDGAGYIVMEYVSGSSLREIREQQRMDTGRPLPVELALSYALEVLAALGFLHSRGLIYCDLKPDNVIQTGELVKLIDLGGVRRIDDDGGNVYGTIGYQAPEVGEIGPSVSSDLYTVGRLMAVLSMNFPGYQDPARYATALPPAAEHDALRLYPAFHHLLLRTTDPDPARRFRSASDLAEQVFGVLRQVVAATGGTAVQVASSHFSGERAADADEPSWRALPLPAPVADDPEAGVLAHLDGAPPDQVLDALRAVPSTPQVRLARVRAAIECGDVMQATEELERLAPPGWLRRPEPGPDWRTSWWAALTGLAAGDQNLAGSPAVHMEAVAAWLPGELAPLLALGTCHEARGNSLAAHGLPPEAAEQWHRAATCYGTVSVTDPAMSAASFGSARVLTRLGDRAGAVASLQRVPDTAAAHTTAQVRLCRLLCQDVGGAQPSAADLTSASVVLDGLAGHDVAPTTLLRLRRDLFTAALTLDAGDCVGLVVAGTPCHEHTLRLGLEATLRDLAAHAGTPAERADLVDAANRYRPWSLT
jgi:serine/threonine-protein kinase PknG